MHNTKAISNFACIKQVSMTASMHARLFAFAIVFAQVAAVCYLEDTSQDCSVCWVTTFSSSDDSVGVTKMAACPESVKAKYDLAPPLEMYEGEEYPVQFSLEVDNSVVTVVPAKIKKDQPEVADVPHANIHSCIASRGACTPFVSNTPGLSTHTPASNGMMDATGVSSFLGNVELDVDTYIIIAHIRFFVPTEEAHGKATKYDVAVGLKREVLQKKSEISTDAYIMAGVVGFILVMFSGAIAYMVKQRILDLDKIMAALFSDAVTLPVDVVCGVADAAAFTVSLLTVMEDQALLSVVPICWLFCGVAWLVSLHNGFHDIVALHHMYVEKTNREAFESRMMERMTRKWLQRRPSQAAGADKSQKKGLLRKLSDEMATITGNSEAHHKAMHDFDRADNDFHRRKRTIAGILLEGLPITALQAYVLIVGEQMETVAVLALLLAALLLGTSMQGLGDYGHAKQRREDALRHFDSLFGSDFVGTAGRSSALWKQNSVDLEEGNSAFGGWNVPAVDQPPSGIAESFAPVSVVSAEQFGWQEPDVSAPRVVMVGEVQEATEGEQAAGAEGGMARPAEKLRRLSAPPNKVAPM